MEAVIRPKERLSLINAAMEHDLAHRRERDHSYEGCHGGVFHLQQPLQVLIRSMQNTYQRPMLPYPKLMPTPSRSTPSPDVHGRQGQEA